MKIRIIISGCVFICVDAGNPVLLQAFNQAVLPAFKQGLVYRLQMDT